MFTITALHHDYVVAACNDSIFPSSIATNLYVFRKYRVRIESPLWKETHWKEQASWSLRNNSHKKNSELHHPPYIIQPRLCRFYTLLLLGSHCIAPRHRKRFAFHCVGLAQLPLFLVDPAMTATTWPLTSSYYHSYPHRYYPSFVHTVFFVLCFHQGVVIDPSWDENGKGVEYASAKGNMASARTKAVPLLLPLLLPLVAEWRQSNWPFGHSFSHWFCLRDSSSYPVRLRWCRKPKKKRGVHTSGGSGNTDMSINLAVTSWALPCSLLARRESSYFCRSLYISRSPFDWAAEPLQTGGGGGGLKHI